jgi:hypothetical protein
MKIYLTNGSYKTLRVTSSLTSEGLIKSMVEKLNLPPNYIQYFDIIEVKKDQRESRYIPSILIIIKNCRKEISFGRISNGCQK